MSANPKPPASAPPPPPPPQKDTFTVLFDGSPLEVPKDLNLIDAAKLAGVDIPHFCYHPRLSVVGQCRMCMVEIEGIPKIQAACTTPLKDGLSSRRRPTRSRPARAATMEFLLINHPLDCPICDQAGECTLQDNSFGYGNQLSNYDEQKRQYPTFDRTMIGPHVIADMTRCIQCTRCIRFTQEIAGTSELTFLDRGRPHARVDPRGSRARQRLVGLRGGRVPRRRPDGPRFPVPQPRLVSQEDEVGLPGLQRRLQRLDRIQGRRRLPLPAAPEPGGQ